VLAKRGTEGKKDGSGKKRKFGVEKTLGNGFASEKFSIALYRSREARANRRRRGGGDCPA